MKRFYTHLFTTLSLIALSLACQNICAQTGVLDPTFGNNGKVLTPPLEPTSQDNLLWSMALQPDGKILGLSSTKLNNLEAMVLTRYKSNGNLDSSFGFNGIVTAYDTATFGPDFTSMDLQSDGKIICSKQIGDMFARRFNPDGSPDSTFESTVLSGQT